MPRIVRRRALRSPLWPSVILGAALGAVGAWFVLRGSRAEPATDPLAPPRPRRAPSEPDLEAMSERLRRLAGADGLRLRSLGGGILELVGTAGADLDVPALLAALAAEPRVSVVVNRAWTPESMDPDDPSASASAPARS